MADNINDRTWVLALEAPSLSSVRPQSNRKGKLNAEGLAPIPCSPPPLMETTYQVPTASTGIVVSLTVSSDPSVTPVSVHPTSSVEPEKRKRGRPRKYAPDGSMNSGIISPPSEEVKGSSIVRIKGRGRPPGSGTEPQLPNLGSAGSWTGFRPHVITVKAGEDVLAKLMSFSQSISQAICILSANGSISNVTIQQAAISYGTITYEVRITGQFEILSLSGYFLLSESGGERSRIGGFRVLLARPDGHVIGGGVARVLTVASTVQIVVGSFGMQGQQQ